MKRVLIRFLDGQSLIHSIPNVLGYLVVAYPGQQRADRRVRLTTYKNAMPVYEEVAAVGDEPATGFIPSRVESGQGQEMPDDWMEEPEAMDERSADWDPDPISRQEKQETSNIPAPPPPPHRRALAEAIEEVRQIEAAKLPPGIQPEVAAARRKKQADQRKHDNKSVKRSYRLSVKED